MCCDSRFCAECIVTALRSGNKECPTCRKKLVSKRSLRPDPNFDQLVEKIFPNREEYEAHQESILESVTRSHSQNFITSIKGMKKTSRLLRNTLISIHPRALFTHNICAHNIEIKRYYNKKTFFIQYFFSG